MLELMPPAYKPAPRTGVIGVGNLKVLEWVRNRFEIGVSELGLKAIGYPIDVAAMNLVGEFAEGIRAEGRRDGADVQLPIQFMLITEGKLRNLFFSTSPTGETWTPLTADPRTQRPLLFSVKPPPKAKRFDRAMSATQVFP